MIAFKDMVQNDLEKVFFNTNEYGSKHRIKTDEFEEKEIIIVIDNDELEDRKAKANYSDAIYNASMLIYVKEKDFGYRPAKDARIFIDKRVYRITQSNLYADGMFELVCEVSR